MSFEAALSAVVRAELASVHAAIAELKALITAAPKAKTTKAAAPAAPATESAPPAAAPAPQAASAPAAPAAPVAPAAPTISKEKLNKAVLAVASVNREAAVSILAKHGAVNTATLPADKYQAVFDDFEEKLAQIQAASAQASLV